MIEGKGGTRFAEGMEGYETLRYIENFKNFSQSLPDFRLNNGRPLAGLITLEIYKMQDKV